MADMTWIPALSFRRWERGRISGWCFGMDGGSGRRGANGTVVLLEYIAAIFHCDKVVSAENFDKLDVGNELFYISSRQDRVGGAGRKVDIKRKKGCE